MLKNKKIMAVLMAVLAVCVACVFCFTACDAVVTNECNCDCGCENCTCNHDGETETPREIQTYRFEAEEAELYADEAEMIYWLDNEVSQGSYITGMGFIFDVQEDDTASGEMSVGYLAHNNPTVTFVITSDIATTATLTIGAASCDVNTDGISSVFGLMGTGINSYSGADHDILTVNGASIALSGELEGSDSVFSTDGLAMNNWGELTAEIELNEGTNAIVLMHDGAGVNFDYIELETTGILTFEATDNDDFTYLPNGEYVPEEDEEPDPGTGDEPDNPDEPGTGDEPGEEVVYDNNMTFEAENAMLLNSVGATGATNLIGTEDTTLDDGTIITNVKNFNTIGDMIVFQVLASAAIENMAIAITAGNGATFGGTFEDNNEILTVNGGDPISLEGTLTNSAFNWSTYGLLTGTISLVAGINYIAISAASTSRSGYLNVDKIDLEWNGSATITDYTTASSVYDIDTSETMTIEAEDAMLLNPVGTSGISNLLGTEVSSSTGVTQVKNFNLEGDKIVFQVYASSAVTATLGAMVYPSTDEFIATDHPTFLQVNGEAVEMDGDLEKGAYGELTAAISLEAGINYIVLELDVSGGSFLGMNLGYMNVDYISLAW